MVELDIVLGDLWLFSVVKGARKIICSEFLPPRLGCDEPTAQGKKDISRKIRGVGESIHPGMVGTYMALDAATSNLRARKKRSRVKVSSLSV